jgi:hypothetical protein
MNITEKIIFIHMPKTGGTFVSSVLNELYQPAKAESKLDRFKFKLKRAAQRYLKVSLPIHQEFNKHGTCRDIPDNYKHLPIVSCMRNPYDWYVSSYQFGWWKSHPEDYPNLVNDPMWPNLSFEYFLKLSNQNWLNMMNPSVSVNSSLGRLTTLFINYYCRNPERILTMNGSTQTLFEAIQEDMYVVDFIDTKKLNENLYLFLKSKSYSPKTIDFILKKKKINSSKEEKNDLLTLELKKEIRQRDRILFMFFPGYDTLEQ